MRATLFLAVVSTRVLSVAVVEDASAETTVEAVRLAREIASLKQDLEAEESEADPVRARDETPASISNSDARATATAAAISELRDMLQQSQTILAAARVQQALRADPSNEELLRIQAEVAVRSGHFDKALEVIDLVLLLSPLDKALQVYAAIIAGEAGSFARAAAQLCLLGASLDGPVAAAQVIKSFAKTTGKVAAGDTTGVGALGIHGTIQAGLGLEAQLAHCTGQPNVVGTYMTELQKQFELQLDKCELPASLVLIKAMNENFPGANCG